MIPDQTQTRVTVNHLSMVEGGDFLSMWTLGWRLLIENQHRIAHFNLVSFKFFFPKTNYSLMFDHFT